MPHPTPLPRTTLAIVSLLVTSISAQNVPVPAYCRVATPGTEVVVQRPASTEEPIDDVNWFARPVPVTGRYIVGFASHDQNYLYDLTNGRRVKMPDKSDAVATPDGRFVTVPSHYTATKTVNFYDARDARLPARRGPRCAGREAGVRPCRCGRRGRLLPVGRRVFGEHERRRHDHCVPDDVLGRQREACARIPDRGLHLHREGRPVVGERLACDAAMSPDHPRPVHAVHLQGRAPRRRPRRRERGRAGHPQDLRNHRGRSGSAGHHLRASRGLRLRGGQGRLQLRRLAHHVPHQQARLSHAVRQRRAGGADHHRHRRGRPHEGREGHDYRPCAAWRE